MIAEATHTIERAYDRFKRAMRERVGYFRPVRVEAYPGHGNDEVVWLAGRVLANLPINSDTGQSALVNAIHMLRRYESDEVPGARVRLHLGDRSVEIESGEEGHIRCELDLPEELADSEQMWHEAQAEILNSGRPSVQPARRGADRAPDDLVILERGRGRRRQRHHRRHRRPRPGCSRARSHHHLVAPESHRNVTGGALPRRRPVEVG